MAAVSCPICNKQVRASDINAHIDTNCQTHVLESTPTLSPAPNPSVKEPVNIFTAHQAQKRSAAASFFQTPVAKRHATTSGPAVGSKDGYSTPNGAKASNGANASPLNGSKHVSLKRSYDEGPGMGDPVGPQDAGGSQVPNAAPDDRGHILKRAKIQRSAPLAERMRPQTLDDINGQDLVGPSGLLRSLIESDRVPSMILWGSSGTGKTTIAGCIAQRTGSRFIELNATSTGVAEVKKYFAEAANDLSLTGRKTIIFCDEIHRFSKSQQDVFLKPVEAGTVTLIGATTENPSFKVQSALLSRCRTFTLAKLSEDDIKIILLKALKAEESETGNDTSSLLDEELLSYLATFSDGDARTALNLLELALSLSHRAGVTKEAIKHSLTKTLVYDRAGDQHYDTISAFHKSVRGSNADAALYYLARMLQSGEDPLFIARRMVVIASEDVGLADSSLLTLATAAYTAAQQIGMPEARIPLAHCAVALSLAPKSTRAYRGLNSVYAALDEPGVASLPIPIHLRNAPTRLMRDLGYGRTYKYPPNYVNGIVKQEYLPIQLLGRRFLEDGDLGTEIDQDLMNEG